MDETTATTKEEVWELFKETDRQMKESARQMKEWAAETDRQMKERAAETDRQMKERAAETDRMIQEIGQEIRALSAKTDREIAETNRGIKETRALFETQWGRLMESLVEGDLVQLLQKRNIAVHLTCPNVKGVLTYTDADGREREQQFEMDIIAINDNEIVVVEVKTTLRVQHVDHFMQVLERYVKWASSCKGKKVYGAVAYLRADSKANVHAARQKLFVIRATGNSASITNPEDFEPRVFC